MWDCNGCCLERLRQQHGERLIHLNDNWYVYGEAPSPGQGEPSSLRGVPIRWIAWFMSTGHACGKRLPKGHEFFGEHNDPLRGSVGMSEAPLLAMRARNVLRDLVGVAVLECALRHGEREWRRSHEQAPHYTTRPGALIERQPAEVRALLQHLRSDDLASETMGPWVLPGARRWRSSVVPMPGTCLDRQG